MGLNAKEIQLGLCRVLQVSIETSNKIIQRHPRVSGALLVLIILYIFLSYIYHFLLYMSPFLVCTAIFVRIFWSSEQTQLKHVKGEEKKVEQRRMEKQYSDLPSYGRRDLLLQRNIKYSPRNALSRRRNFKDKKWDLQSIAEEKDKDFSTVISNDFTKTDSERSTENKYVKASEKEESSLDFRLSSRKFQTPDIKTSPLRSEPSICDLVVGSDSDQQNSRLDGGGGLVLETEKLEDKDDDDDEEEEEAKEDRDKVDWNDNDQKNLMDLGISEIERNRRLESLMARRRASQQLKEQIEKGLIDIKSVAPNQIAPVFITKGNAFDSQKDDIYGLEMPGSAPSVLRPSRNPFDLPYDPSEEKPNLTGDSFHQEFTIVHQKDMAFCRHESFTYGPSFALEPMYDTRESNPFFSNGRKVSDRLEYPRFRRLSEKGNHDLIIEQLFSKGDSMLLSGSGVKAPKPLINKEETTSQEDTKSKTDIIDMKGKEVENAHETKSMSDHRSESDLMKNSNYGFAETDHRISNVERAGVSEKRESRIQKPDKKLLNIPPISSSNILEESPFDFPSPTKNQEDMFFAERRIFHHPRYSIASDLQVELSEGGSPTLTVNETHTFTDGESIVYDGDIDKDITSGSDDIGAASFHSREVHGVSEEDIAEVGFTEVNNSNIFASLIPLKQIDEEDTAAVNSFSSISDTPGDTPTHTTQNFDNGIFYNLKKAVVETQAPQPSTSSNVSSPQHHFINSSLDLPPHQTQSEKPEERCNLSENSTNEAQVANHVNDSTATDANYLNRNEDPGSSIVHQALIDEVSVNSLAFFSPRSVLPEETLTNQVPLSAFNQQILADVPQLIIEDMAQTTSNNVIPPATMPQNMQPLMDHPTIQQRNGDFSNSQEASCSSTVADDPSTTDKLSRPLFDDEEGKEERNPCKPEGKTEASITTSPVHSKLPKDNITSIVPGNKEPADPPENSIGRAKISGKENDAIICNKEDEKKLKNGENDAVISKPDKPNDSSESVSYVHSETKKNDSSGKVSNMHESQQLAEDDMVKEDDMEKDKMASGNIAKDLSQPLEVTGSRSAKDDMEKDKMASGNVAKDSPQQLEVTSLRPAKDTEGKSNEASKNDAIKQELNHNEAMVSSRSVGKSDKVSITTHMKEPGEVFAVICNKEDVKEKLEDCNPPKPCKPHDSSEKRSNVHSESKQLAEDDMEKDKMAGGNTAKDSPQQLEVTSSSPGKDTEGKSNEANKIDPVKQELVQNEATVSSRSVGESDNVSITTHMKEPGEVVSVISNKEDVKEKLKNDNPPKPCKPNDSSEKVSYVHSESNELVPDDMEKDKLESGNIAEDSQQQLMVNEVTSSRATKDTEGKSNEVNKNEAIKQELNQNEDMASSTSVGKSDTVIITKHTEEFENFIQLEDVNAPQQGKPNYGSENEGNIQGELKEQKLASGNITKDLPQPMVTEPIIPKTNEALAEDS